MDITDLLSQLGKRLQQARIKAEQPQAKFAARIGASVPTLRRMENGDPETAIKYWIRALEVLNRLQDVDSILREEISLFEEVLQKAVVPRKRVRRRSPWKGGA